ncbi:MAG: PilZ domain-containing protein [Gimesia sp.]|nr:PilZ domain-containing protein [Planctomycetota bacterium]MDF1742060.1 PilZ domain-containing protein [Gimesia sp.]
MSDRRKSRSRRSGNERREYQRTKVTTEVSLLRSGSTSGNEPLNGILFDVSPNGIRILIDIPLSIGESLLVEVHNDGEHLFNSTAKVIWQEQDSSGKYSTGCELCVLLTEKQENILNEILNRTLNSNDFARN